MSPSAASAQTRIRRHRSLFPTIPTCLLYGECGQRDTQTQIKVEDTRSFCVWLRWYTGCLFFLLGLVHVSLLPVLWSVSGMFSYPFSVAVFSVAVFSSSWFPRHRSSSCKQTTYTNKSQRLQTTTQSTSILARL